ncbi:PorT family protein [Chitinophagaceae bacterium LB-8]|uniref:PorT family protein n=1 Tax=Paraflavisolibacter caeni TaxID=2982496 RepID=A0A9X2XNU7_9BACT|nr:porin family protein [Paraflavisolibacter caeni]MCU7549149.1 PorT family protein [Paraflavisolibacter caeni]
MKKVTLIFSILMLSTGVFAQIVPKFGLKAGVNLANWSFANDDIEKDFRTGFHIGALAHMHLSPQWALQPEVQYSSQGTKTDLGSQGSYTWKADYINIPVMVQYMFDNGFRLEAGPQLGFLVNGELEDENGNKDDISNDLKSTDVGLGFGANYLTYSGLGLGVRYNLGLTDINKERTNETKNRVLQLSLFYMFDSHHKAKSR